MPDNTVNITFAGVDDNLLQLWQDIKNKGVKPVTESIDELGKKSKSVKQELSEMASEAAAKFTSAKYVIETVIEATKKAIEMEREYQKEKNKEAVSSQAATANLVRAARIRGGTKESAVELSEQLERLGERGGIGDEIKGMGAYLISKGMAQEQITPAMQSAMQLAAAMGRPRLDQETLGQLYRQARLSPEGLTGRGFDKAARAMLGAHSVGVSTEDLDAFYATSKFMGEAGFTPSQQFATQIVASKAAGGDNGSAAEFLNVMMRRLRQPDDQGMLALSRLGGSAKFDFNKLGGQRVLANLKTQLDSLPKDSREAVLKELLGKQWQTGEVFFSRYGELATVQQQMERGGTALEEAAGITLGTEQSRQSAADIRTKNRMAQQGDASAETAVKALRAVMTDRGNLAMSQWLEEQKLRFGIFHGMSGKTPIELAAGQLVRMDSPAAGRSDEALAAAIKELSGKIETLAGGVQKVDIVKDSAGQTTQNAIPQQVPAAQLNNMPAVRQ